MAHESSTTTQTTSKRKRGNLDHEPPRAAPGYRNEATGEMEYGVDDNAITQLSAFNNQDAQQNGGNVTSAGAADTAAAALSQHYQMGDQSFQSQGSTGDAPYGDPSYIDQLKESPTQGQGPISHHSPTGNTPGKPQVGSDEWHKVRRDNHKEGSRGTTDQLPLKHVNIDSQLNVAAVKP
jgi:hypothetical protein